MGVVDVVVQRHPVRAGPAPPGFVVTGQNQPVPSTTAAGEDIIALLEAEGVPLTPEFMRRLRDRRRQLRPRWERVIPHRVGRSAASGWDD